MNARKRHLSIAVAASVAGLSMGSAQAVETWSYTYNSTGQMLTSDGPRTDVSDITTYTYDASGNLATITNALGHVTRFQNYNGRGQPETLIDPNGVETAFTYHARGWLLTSTTKDPGGNAANDATTTYGYNNVGLVTSITLPDGQVLNYEYDGARRLTAIGNSLGERIEYTLDAAGNRTQEVIKDGGSSIVKTQARAYDELSRLMQVVGANNQTVNYSYDVNDNVTVTTDGKAETTSLAYDALNRLVSDTDPDTFSANYTYDTRDRLKTVTDQRGLVTTYNYNGLNYLTSMVSPDTGTTVYTYDDAGNRISSTDARGVVVNYSYDALNRLTGKTYPASTGENITYSYDDTSGGNQGLGRLTGITDESGTTGFSYDHRGNLVGKTYSIAGTSYSLQYAYDLSNNLSQITYPGGRLVNYSRDSQGRVTGITTQQDSNAAAVAVVSNVTYLPYGPVNNFTYSNGIVQTISYDQDYRITSNQAQGTNTVLDLDYSYDANNNIASINDQQDAGNNQSFQYDKLDRLKQADGGYGQIDYDYDGVGNRTQKTATQGADTTTETYNYSSTSNRLNQVNIDDGSSQTQRDFQYDSNGNVIKDTKPDGTVHDFTYNNANRYAGLNRNTDLRAIYFYNALGQRTAKVAVGSTTIGDHYHYDEAGQLIVVTDDTGTAKREYIYLDAIKVAVLMDDAFANEWENFHNNPTNTAPVAVADSVSATEDQIAVINHTALLANDSDADGDSFSITAVSNAVNGTAVLNSGAGTITFTPDLNYNGSATFDYTISDGVDIASATVTLTVAAVNDIPVAVNDTATATEDSPAVLNIADLLTNDSDVDGDSLSITAVSNSVNGVAVLNSGAGTITFSPAADYSGSAAFDYTVSDGVDTANATVALTVNAVNDAPVASADTATATEDTAAVITVASLLANDSDPDGDALSITAVANATNGSISLNTATGEITFTPNADYSGSATFSYTLSDGAETANGTVNVSVTAVNDAPLAANDAATVIQDQVLSISFASILANDSDVDGDSLTVAAVSNAVNGSASIDTGAGTVSFTHTAGYTGAASLDYTLSDGTTTDTATVAITVTASGTPPYGEDAIYGTAAGETLTGLSNVANTLVGLGGDDTLQGGNEDDILDGGTGNDMLNGGQSDDTYVFNPGDGQDTITESYAIGNNDVLKFGAGIGPGDISIAPDSKDMVITIGSGGDQIRIVDWSGPQFRLETVEFVGSTAWGASTIHDKWLNQTGTSGDDTLASAHTSETTTLLGLGGNDTLSDNFGADVLDGGEGNDTLQADYGNDTLLGRAGADVLEGGQDDDTLEGGTGNDTLRGGGSNDTYIFNPGDGQDTITESYALGNTDVLRFGAGISPADIVIAPDHNDMVITVGASGDQIRIISWKPVQFRLESFEFDGGAVWNASTIHDKWLNQTGTPGNDTLVSANTSESTTLLGLGGDDTLDDSFGDDVLDGGEGNDTLLADYGDDTLLGGAGTDVLEGGQDNDTLTGGTGNDTLRGGGGDDSYVFNSGDGQDTINEGYQSPNNDVLKFGAGIVPADVSITSDGDDMIVTIGAEGDQVRINNWNQAEYRLEMFEFADGTQWDANYLHTQWQVN